MPVATELVPAPIVTVEQRDVIRRTVASGCTSDANLELFLYDNARRGVHPLDRQLHYTEHKGRYTPIVSIDFLRGQAAATGEMAGSDDATFRIDPDEGTPISATVVVYRLTQGQRFAYVATARFDEYRAEAGASGRGDVMWRTKPFLMLAKCAEALALRKAFPQQLSGLYTADEFTPEDDERRAETRVRVDPTTGEETPRSAAPSGYRYIDRYWEEGGWHHVEFLSPSRTHSVGHYKTKLAKIGQQLQRAYAAQQPVALDISPNSKPNEPGWVNSVEVWTPPADLDAAEARRLDEDNPPA